MKAFLLYRDRDFDFKQGLPWNAASLMQDLELKTLLRAMSQDDKKLAEVTPKVLLRSLTDCDSVEYRQAVLKDCLGHPDVLRTLYALALQALESPKQHYWGAFTHYPDAILSSAVETMNDLMEIFRKLKSLADENAEQFVSEGFRRFFGMIREELSDEYFESIRQHLKELKFRDGVLVSAQLSTGNKGIGYVLRRPSAQKRSWTERLFGPKTEEYTFSVPDRDDNGLKALSFIQDHGINLAANALAQSTDHIVSFFRMLQSELAFYIGCLNLSEQLAQLGEPFAFPEPVAAGERDHSFRELYDVCLSLTLKQKVTGNSLGFDRKDLVVVTGANQGGKSTFLRSIGLAQLMMQCGMFVPAESFRANLCAGLVTHYRREEDSAMKSGKLDEELGRMSGIVDRLTPNAMLLFNESFAATNEREGSEIARQIVSALLEKRIKVFFVTHLYEFARGFYERKTERFLFLRAERQQDGTRTFRLREGEPLDTSFGEDLYRSVFQDAE